MCIYVCMYVWGIYSRYREEARGRLTPRARLIAYAPCHRHPPRRAASPGAEGRSPGGPETKKKYQPSCSLGPNKSSRPAAAASPLASPSPRSVSPTPRRPPTSFAPRLLNPRSARQRVEAPRHHGDHAATDRSPHGRRPRRHWLLAHAGSPIPLATRLN